MSVWVEAARPRTLPAAVVPVAVGTATAVALDASLAWDRAVLALVVALALQVAVNFANDLFDGVAGIDTDERIGPRRVVAAGIVTPAAREPDGDARSAGTSDVPSQKQPMAPGT